MSTHAASTYHGLVTRALDFKGKTYWFGLGRKTTPWPDENNPPSPTPGSTDIEEPLLFVKQTLITLVKPVTQEEYDLLAEDERVTVNGLYFGFVDDVNGYGELARWVFIKGIADPSAGMPAGTFRQVGLFYGLVPGAGHENDTWLAPADVASHGIIQWIDQNPPQTISATIRALIKPVLEFR